MYFGKSRKNRSAYKTAELVLGAKRSVLVSGTDSLRNVRVKFGVMLSPHVGWGNKKKRPAGQVRVAGVHTNVLKT